MSNYDAIIIGSGAGRTKVLPQDMEALRANDVSPL